MRLLCLSIPLALLIFALPENGFGRDGLPLDQGMQYITVLKCAVIPEVSFQDEPLSNVVQFIRDNLPREESDVHSRSLNVVLALSPEAAAKHHVTLTLRYVSLWEVLTQVSSLTDLPYYIKGSALVIGKCDEVQIRRVYHVLPDAFAFAPGSNTNGTVNLTGYFESLGVKFPKGSLAQLIPGHGRLLIQNTESNLAFFEQLLEELNWSPPQVEVQLRLVEFSDPDALSCTNGFVDLNENSLVDTACGERTLLNASTISPCGRSSSFSIRTDVETAKGEVLAYSSPDGSLVTLHINAEFDVSPEKGGPGLSYAVTGQYSLYTNSAIRLWLLTTTASDPGRKTEPPLARCLDIRTRFINPDGKPIKTHVDDQPPAVMF